MGLLDLLAAGCRPFAVSQTVRGDAEKQKQFADIDSGKVRHLQLGHAANTGVDDERSQRARSFIFIAFGVLAATSTAAYRDGGTVSLYVPENGFIALNPPLTGLRLGALSTRTAHPNLLRGLEEVFAATGLRVSLINPYAEQTKGEMLSSCGDPTRLAALAATSTSCGRFLHYGYTHCGRCVPCQVRRAALLHWGVADATSYVHDDLGRDDADHAGFDDVRAVQIAVQAVRKDGLDSWLGTTLASVLATERKALGAMIGRGLKELATLHRCARRSMIDFHCHIDLYPNPHAVLREAARRGVRILSVTTTPSAWPGTLALSSGYPNVMTAPGLHPQLAAERKHELPRFEHYLGDTRFVGEVGLDGTSSLRRTWSDQVAVLNTVLSSCANAGGRILSLHSRSAASAVLDCLERHPLAGTAVMHWFSGSKAELDRAVELGCWFSVNPNMLLSEKGRRLTQAMPHDRLLTETDGPFAQLSGRSLKPHMVSAIAEALANIWGAPSTDVIRILDANLSRLLDDPCCS